MNEDFYENQIFEGEYPPEAAIWCNESGIYHIDEIESENNIRRFQIVKNSEPTQAELNQNRIIELEYYLASTDWYVIRAGENPDKPVPEDIALKRQEAREEISRLRAEPVSE